MSTIYDVYLNQGEDFSMDVKVTDDDNVYLDLASYAVNAQIRNPESRALLANMTCTKSPTETGLVTLSIPAADTRLIPCASAIYDSVAIYAWDMTIKNTNETRRVLQGKVFLSAGVTR